MNVKNKIKKEFKINDIVEILETENNSKIEIGDIGIITEIYNNNLYEVTLVESSQCRILDSHFLMPSFYTVRLFKKGSLKFHLTLNGINSNLKRIMAELKEEEDIK